MKLYEFLQKIEDCGQEFSIKLEKYNTRWLNSTLNIQIDIKNYKFVSKYIENADKIQKKFPEDFTEEWKEIEIFIKKSLAKVAIDEEE
jgi:hypothetical protein